MRRFIIGDIHAAYKGFKELLDKVNFDYNKDMLISLGDIVDGWSETKECLDLMMSIKNLIFIRGNHDEWAIKYYNGDSLMNKNDRSSQFYAWYTQGGQSTIESLGDIGEVDKKYIDFLNSSVYYHELDDKLFVHASVPLACCIPYGDNIEPVPLNLVPTYNFCWDRDMVREVYLSRKNVNFKWGNKFNNIYVGHTPTTSFNSFYKTPQKWSNVWLMDTGAAFNGSISIMNIDTEEIIQSSQCQKIYHNEKGRNKLSWDEIKRFG